MDYLADSFPASIQIIYPEEVRGLYHQRRLLEDGSVIHLLVNSGDKAFEAEITVHGIQAIHFDTIHGENRAFPNIRTDVSSSTFSHHFEAQDSLLFVATTSPVERAIMQAPALENSQASTAVPVVTNGELELLEIIPQSENRLVLDFCDLHMSGDTLRKNIPTWVAQDLIFKRHGFMRNPWHRAIQYRRQTMDRNTFGAESGFVAEYSFVWNEESPPARLQLAMECPDLFSIEFNGTPLPTDAFQPCELDPWIRSSEIAGLVCKGINRIRISAHPFDVRMELEPVFILGAFSARPDCIGFELGNPDSLRMGSWKSQGMPFYDRAMDYVMRMPALPPPTCDAWIEFDLVGRATLVEAIHGTRKIGEFGWAPGPIRIHAREFASDSRTLTFRVIGSPHNLFGAFHDPKKPEKIMGNFFSGSKKGPVSGDSYDIRDYGIFEPVRWSLVTGGAS